MTKKRVMPIRTKRVDLDGDFEGWYFVVRTNPRVGTTEKMAEGGSRALDGLAELVAEWNFVDEEGYDLPLTPEGVRAVPQDLLVTISGRIQDILNPSAS